MACQATLVHKLVGPERGMAGSATGNSSMRKDTTKRLRPTLSVERAWVKEHTALEYGNTGDDQNHEKTSQDT